MVNLGRARGSGRKEGTLRRDAQLKKEDAVSHAVPAFRLWLGRPGGGDRTALARWIVARLAPAIALTTPAGFTAADVPADGAAQVAMDDLDAAMRKELAGGATAANLRTYVSAQLQQTLNVTVS